MHFSLLTLPDLSSLFDTIDYYILLDLQIYSYEISGTCLSWVRSNLSNRRQSIAIAYHTTSTIELHYGVTQSSAIGHIFSFATCYHFLFKSSDILQVSTCLTDDIQIATSILPQHIHCVFSYIKACISYVNITMTYLLAKFCCCYVYIFSKIHLCKQHSLKEMHSVLSFLIFKEIARRCLSNCCFHSSNYEGFVNIFKVKLFILYLFKMK